MMKETKKKSSIWFIFITLLIEIIGWGIIIPVLPKLISELGHTDISGAAKTAGWLIFSYSITQFLFAPMIGNLSDQYGRRKIILISLFGFFVDYLFLAFSSSLIWLFIGRILCGVAGASVTTATAYIADISSKEDRAKNFGLIGAAFGIGFIIGPVLGGILGQYGSRVPFYGVSILCFINWLYGYFILPESLALEHRKKFEWKRANPIGAFLLFKKYPLIYPYLIALGLIYIASHAIQTNWSYFVIYRFHWNEKMIGISLGVMGLLVGLVQGGLVRFTSKRFGNEKSILYGFAFYALGMLLFSFSDKPWMIFAVLVPYCLGGIAGPALQAMVSNKISPRDQGEMQGALTSLMSACAVIGPVLMTNVFYYFTHNQAPFLFPGASFFLGFILMLIASGLILKNNRKHSK